MTTHLLYLDPMEGRCEGLINREHVVGLDLLGTG